MSLSPTARAALAGDDFLQAMQVDIEESRASLTQMYGLLGEINGRASELVSKMDAQYEVLLKILDSMPGKGK